MEKKKTVFITMDGSLIHSESKKMLCNENANMKRNQIQKSNENHLYFIFRKVATRLYTA